MLIPFSSTNQIQESYRLGGGGEGRVNAVFAVKGSAVVNHIFGQSCRRKCNRLEGEIRNILKGLVFTPFTLALQSKYMEFSIGLYDDLTPPEAFFLSKQFCTEKEQILS